ncbi:Repeat domain-containing protein [Reichenbachiella faecimaris]|uniref:Repeat domain-containing protein n=1 Tax=Reichenbachiella faecimaris TaxID=692418 RepID=A0A1W2G5J2_REIFA|nr:VCBS repeat-containing protein [Reichenbachiella faecimaris]SMD31935.1 Repeat domain-containing protein [Reichenbachiella faecimaris]
MKKLLTVLLRIIEQSSCVAVVIIMLGACDKADNTEKKKFTLIPSEKSGITFENTIVDETERNILIYDNYYQGSGVGLGDFNNDGLTDIFFGGNLVSDKLYINQGEFSFQDQTEIAGIINDGGWTSGVTLVDINMDGHLDIYLSRELYDESPKLRENKLYINNGDLTFSERAQEYGLAENQRTRHASFFDYDKDGDPDVFLLNQPPNPGNYSAYYGIDLLAPQYSPRLLENRNGKFIDVTVRAKLLKSGFCNSVITTDLNGDGWIDIYVTNDFEAPDFLYINNGDGTFSDQAVKQLNHMSYFSMGVDAADINHDGKLDIMVTDMSAEDNFRLKANMSGMNPKAFWNVVKNGGHYQYMYNMLQMNQGDSSYSDIGQLSGLSSTDWSWSSFFADFDNDGYQDVFVANGLLRDMRNTDAKKKFPKYVENTINDYIKANPNAGDVSIWDILDLEEALSIIPSQKLANYTFKNNGDLTFAKVSDLWGLNQKTFSNGAAYADLDNDGDLDLVINNINDKASIYRNNFNKENNYLRVQIKPTINQTMLGTKVKIKYGEETQYQELTNVRGMFSTSESIIHFGLGKTESIDLLEVEWLNGEKSTLYEVKVNQTLIIDSDLAQGNPAPASPPTSKFFTSVIDSMGIDFVHEENEFDDFESQILLPHKLSNFGPALAIGDLNNDQLDDFFVGGASGQSGAIYFQTMERSFSRQNFKDEDSKFEDVDAAFIDFDNDGDLDLYIVSGGNEFELGSKYYHDRLYINDGLGSFSLSNNLLPEISMSGSKIRPFDFDQDNDLDLLLTGRLDPHNYPAPTSSRLLQNNNGVFTDVTGVIAPDLLDMGMATDAMWSDFNGDGSTDLIVVGEWMPITLLKNENNVLRKVEIPSLQNSHGWWFSIEGSDIDKDGDQDYLVGNLGLNYKYKASEKEPFSVHYYDFDDNNSNDIILSYYNFGKEYPLRGRSCSASQVPSLKKEFPTYTEFAGATLSQVYTPEKLASALTYQVESFSSIYLENLGGAKFKAHPLPMEAQIAPINDFLIKDINEDGHADVVIAGNLYASEIETPRADAGRGLLMLGNGKGNFEPVKFERSGISFNSDVKALDCIQIGSTFGVLAASNNGNLKLILAQD